MSRKRFTPEQINGKPKWRYLLYFRYSMHKKNVLIFFR